MKSVLVLSISFIFVTVKCQIIINDAGLNENIFSRFVPRHKRSGGRAEKASKQDLQSLHNAYNEIVQIVTTVQAENDPVSSNDDSVSSNDDSVSSNDSQVTKNNVTEVTDNELSINDPDSYFHGDIDLTKGQVDHLVNSLHRKKRNVAAEPAFHLWTINPIPYRYDKSVPKATRQKIEQAINLWEINTCRKWVHTVHGEDAVEFVNGKGCSSFIGNVGGVQGISILTPGCDTVGIISHEIGHSLGLFHEQSRPDRARHVTINKENIRRSRRHNFIKMPVEDVNTFGMGYDYGSVMHYDGLTREFTYNSNEYSIITNDARFQNTIGQRRGPSFLDYKLVNLAYCSNVCTDELGCLHGGYADPNNCTRCKCPLGLGGKHCQTARASSDGCGGVLHANSSAQYIMSLGYPMKYPLHKECNWYIIGPKDSRIHLIFKSFDFPCHEVCSKSYVEVKTLSDFELTGYRFCCRDTPRQLVSRGNKMIVRFRSYGQSGKGFHAKIFSKIKEN